jgi:hypothetical protein
VPNPNPSPATRFKPGNPGGPGRFPGDVDVSTRRVRAASLSEAQAKRGSFRGSPREFLLAAMIDPEVDYHVRLAAAGQLLRDSKDWDDGDKLTPAERKKRIVELVQRLAMGGVEDEEPPVIDGTIEPNADV